MSQSKDVINLWDKEKHHKIRSIFAQNSSFKDCKFTPDGARLCTLFKDSSVYFWNISNFDPDYKITSLPKELQLQCMDCSVKYLACGGKTPYLVICNIEDYFTTKELTKKLYKLPAGYERGITKLQFLRSQGANADHVRLALLTNGVLMVVEIPIDDETYEESKVDYSKPGERPLKIVMSIKLPHQSITDFDVDRNGYYASLLSSDGTVKIYELEATEKSDKDVMNQKIKKCSRDTVSYHGELYFVDFKDFEIDIKNYSVCLPEEGLLSKDSIKMKDITNRVLNSSIKKNPYNESFSAQKSAGETGYKYQYSAASNISAQNSYIEESKIHNNGYANQLNESEISHVNEFMKIKPHQVATNLLTAGLSTKAASKDVQQDIMIYKQGVKDLQDYSAFSKSIRKEEKTDKPVILEKNFKPIYGTASMQTDLKDMNYDKLTGVLKKYTEYPEKYRPTIWRYLLSLPLKKDTFESLVKRDPHPAFVNLYKKFSVKSYRTYNKLARILSALAHWCPIFGEVEYLPDLVFPFVKVIKSDDLVLFEVLMCFLMQHCQLWFERYPNDPVHLLKTSVDVIIKKESINLYKHFNKVGFGVAQYAWPMLKNGFSVVLPKEDWLRLYDHIFTHHNKPELLYYFTAAYILHFRGTLSRIQSIEQMFEFTENQNPVDMKAVLKHMFKLYKKYQDDDEVYIGTHGNYIPLNADHSYPVFMNYPKESVIYAQKIRSMKLSEEEIAEQKANEIAELRDRVSKLLLRDQQKREQEEAISQFQAQKYAETKQSLEQQILEKLREQDERTEYLRSLETTLQASIQSQETQRILDKQRITTEYEERRRLSEYEHKARLQEESLKSLEHKATQRLLEMMSIREKEEYQRQLNIEAAQRIKEEEARDKAMLEKWRLEDEERKLRAELLIREKVQQREKQVFEYDRQRLDMQHRLHELEKEVYVVQLEKERRLRQAEQDYMFAAQKMKEEVGKKNEYLQVLEATAINDMRAKNQQIVDVTDQRIQAIYQQKKEIEAALEFERQEQERLRKAIEKKNFEEQMMSIKLKEQAKRKEIEGRINNLSSTIDRDRQHIDQTNAKLYHKEQEIIEQQKFKELLETTDENLRKMEEEKLLRANLEYKRSIDDAVYKSQQERDNQMKELIRNREMNFQEYTLKRQNQIREEYMKKLEGNDGEVRQAHSFIETGKGMLSPDRNMGPYDANTEIHSPGMENMSPNQPYGYKSDLSYSINQKYLNKDAYDIGRSQEYPLSINDRMKSHNGALMQSYPLSDNLNGTREEMMNDSYTESYTQNDEYSCEEDEEALRKHEQSKNAFEAYKRSTEQFNGSQGYEEGVLSMKNSTFGMPTQNSQDFQKYQIGASHFGSAEGHPMGYHIDQNTYYHQKGGNFSSCSSHITEEDEGESSLSYIDENDISATSGGSSFYSKRPIEDPMISQNYEHMGKFVQPTSQYENTSDISESSSEYKGRYGQPVKEMSINPFYRPNPQYR